MAYWSQVVLDQANKGGSRHAGRATKPWNTNKQIPASNKIVSTLTDNIGHTLTPQHVTPPSIPRLNSKADPTQHLISTAKHTI